MAWNGDLPVAPPPRFLTKARRDHTIETYQAKRESAIRDTLAYDAAAAAPHWSALLPSIRTAIAT